jgi:hypothetical protein
VHLDFLTMDDASFTLPIAEVPAEPDPIARAWRARARGEARVGRTFARLHDALGEHEVLPLVRERLRAAAGEEAEHGRLCDALAEAYGGAPLKAALPDGALPLETPLTRTLLLVGACCISESIACAYLDRCRASATDARAVEALHGLLRDEVGHAQLGWAHLAWLPRDTALWAGLTRSLPGLVERTRQAWRERIGTLHARPAPEHGYPSVDACIAVVDEAIDGLVLRGFRHLGLDL